MNNVSYNYTIDKKLQLIIHNISGEVRFEDFGEIFSIVVSDPKFQRGMSSIIDISEASVDYDMTKMLLFYDEIENKSNQRGQCKWAIVISEDMHHGYNEMFKTLCEDGNYDIAFFTTQADAKKWVIEKEKKH